MAKRALVIDPADTVANALEDIDPGDAIDAVDGARVVSLLAAERIPFGFKVALVDTPSGGEVRKYGQVIGRASQPIQRGQLVHIHNLEGLRGRGDLSPAGEVAP